MEIRNETFFPQTPHDIRKCKGLLERGPFSESTMWVYENHSTLLVKSPTLQLKSRKPISTDLCLLGLPCPRLTWAARSSQPNTLFDFIFDFCTIRARPKALGLRPKALGLRPKACQILQNFGCLASCAHARLGQSEVLSPARNLTFIVDF